MQTVLLPWWLRHCHSEPRLRCKLRCPALLRLHMALSLLLARSHGACLQRHCLLAMRLGLAAQAGCRRTCQPAAQLLHGELLLRGGAREVVAVDVGHDQLVAQGAEAE